MRKETESTGSLGNPKEERIIKLGLDAHASQITNCRQEGGRLPQPSQKLSWEKSPKWIQGLVATGAKVYSCYEAGPFGYGLHRQLEAMGVKNLVVAPQRWDESGKRVKTDKRDARELVDRLDRYPRGNTKVFSVVRVPPLIKGLGRLTSAILESEILDWSRFQNRRQVSSYTGLCPREESSGSRRKQGSINKHGNPQVRRQLVEAVWRLAKWQPHYPPLKLLREASGTRARKRAVVAVARRLAVDLWRISTGQCSAQKLGLLLAEPAKKA